MQQQTEKTSDEPTVESPRLCPDCDQEVLICEPIGDHPLSIRACEGCGVTIEYDPYLESGGPCPICPGLSGHEVEGEIRHTHRVPIRVSGGKVIGSAQDELDGQIRRQTQEAGSR